MMRKRTRMRTLTESSSNKTKTTMSTTSSKKNLSAKRRPRRSSTHSSSNKSPQTVYREARKLLLERKRGNPIVEKILSSKKRDNTRRSNMHQRASKISERRCLQRNRLKASRIMLPYSKKGKQGADKKVRIGLRGPMRGLEEASRVSSISRTIEAKGTNIAKEATEATEAIEVLEVAIEEKGATEEEAMAGAIEMTTSKKGRMTTTITLLATPSKAKMSIMITSSPLPRSTNGKKK